MSSSQPTFSISHSVSKKGSTIETASGTLVVQPYRPSKDSSQILAKLTFVPRTSQFESSGQDPFRGFYVLFWISIFLFALRTYVTSFEQTGSPLSLSFAQLFSKDAVSLALSDAVLVSSTALAVPFVKLIKNGWIRYMWTGVILQHIYQALMLGIAVQWTFNRQWEWVQSGFFTLHCLVMMMKVHSYIAINGNFAELNLRQKEMMRKLKELVDALPGGWAKAEKDAANGRLQRAKENLIANGLLNAPGLPNVAEDSIPAGTPGSFAGASGACTPQLVAATLRNRLAAHQASEEEPQTTTVTIANMTPSTTPPKSETDESPYFPPSSSSTFPPRTTANDSGSPSTTRHPLIEHPNKDVNELAEAINELEDQLTSPGIGPKGKGKIRFPQNVTLANFVDYQLIPTLVYELEYPRTNRIRLFYVFEKTVAFLGTFTLLYTTAEHYIIPLTPQPDQNFFRSLLDLALPFMLSYLLLFYIIFECICNGFAELSQ
ncbi:hypothetical protein FRC02_011219 [Tulasnella sp. 418]|nr:hypothetical protein FRC02_011219 [Tulasnella sp. 418]